MRDLSRPKLIFIFFILLSIIYCNSLGNDFVWDDETHILFNGYIKDLKFLPKVFSGPMLKNIYLKTNYYRPLQTVSYMLDYRLWRFNPFGYHLTNLLLHFFNAVLIFILLYGLSKSRLVSSLSGIFFIVHPGHTAAVSYISGRADLLAVFFILCALVLYKGSYDYKKPYFLAGSLFSFVLALLSKEIALVVPFLIVLLDYFLFQLRDGTGYRFRQRIKYYAPFLALSIIYLITRELFIVSDINIMPNREQLILSLRSFLNTLFAYVRLLIIPKDIYFDLSLSDAGHFQMTGTLGLILLGAFSLRYSRLAIFGLLWFIACLMPVSSIFVRLSTPLSGNWLYLPSVGFFIMYSVALARIIQAQKRRVIKRLYIIAVSLIIASYGFLVMRENISWADDKTLFEKIARVSPHSSRAHYNLGVVYERSGHIDGAIQEAVQAIALDPENLDAYIMLGDIYLEKKRDFFKAEEVYNKIISIGPKDFGVYARLIRLYRLMGEEGKAEYILGKIPPGG